MEEQQTAGFTAELDKNLFEEYLSALDGLVDESRIHIEEDRIHSAAVDPANVAMVDVELLAEGFSRFNAEDVTFGIDCRKLRELLDGTDDDVVELKYDDNTRKLDMRIGSYLYTYSALSPDSLREEPDIPNLDDLSFSTQMKIGQLREPVEWFDKFADHVSIGYDPANSQFYMEAIEAGSSATDDGVYELQRSELEYVGKPGAADSYFYLDYLKKIVQSVPDETTIKLRVGQEMPNHLSYTLGPTEDQAYGQVKMMQAPRIQSN